MSNEFQHRSDATGDTLYVTIRNLARQYWSQAGYTPAFESFAVANWADYAIALTETPAGGYFYVGDWPTGLTTRGWYLMEVFKQAGVSPDISDTLVGKYASYWNGVALVPESLTIRVTVAATANNGDVLPDVAVTVYTDQACTSPYVNAPVELTNESGRVAFFLPPGTYWAKKVLGGRRFRNNPQKVSVP